jgi:hypothetical protein
MATWYAVFHSVGAHALDFKSIHPAYEDAVSNVNFALESARQMSKFVPEFDETTYVIIPVPILHVGQWKRKKDA